MMRNTCILRVRLLLVFALACQWAAFAHAQSQTGSGSLPAVMPLDLGDGVKMDFVLVPSGSFMMGADQINLAALTEPKSKAAKKDYQRFYGGVDEKPAHRVTIAKPFYLGKFEVTQEQWQKIMGRNPAKNEGPQNPVEQVSWVDCTNFVARLSQQIPGRRFNLPSEAQWEYACRAGGTNEFCFGDDREHLDEYAWNQIGMKIGGTHPVGEKKPNAWGLYDMHGNVWEWCLDVYHKNYEGAPADGSAWLEPAPKSKPYRVQRGGGYASVSAAVRSAHRGKDLAGDRNRHYGLRVLLEIP